MMTQAAPSAHPVPRKRRIRPMVVALWAGLTAVAVGAGLTAAAPGQGDVTALGEALVGAPVVTLPLPAQG